MGSHYFVRTSRGNGTAGCDLCLLAKLDALWGADSRQLRGDQSSRLGLVGLAGTYKPAVWTNFGWSQAWSNTNALTTRF